MRKTGLLIIIGLCTAFAQADREATFVLKDGSVLFGKLNRMANDTVYLETGTQPNQLENKKYPKSTFSEIIFDNGEKFDLTASNYPAKSVVVPPENPGTAAAKNETSRSNGGSAAAQSRAAVSATGIPSGNVSYDLAKIRNPFTFGGLSAVIPGLGQLTQGEYVKAAVIFPLVAGCAVAYFGAWDYTTKTYNDLQGSYRANGYYNNALYEKYIFQSRGSEVLSVVTAVLYVLNIADAAFDARLYNKHLTGRVTNSVSAAGNGISYDLSLNF